MGIEQGTVSLEEVRRAEALRLENERKRIELRRAQQVRDLETHARTLAVGAGMDEAFTQLTPAGRAFFEQARGSGMTAVEILEMEREAIRRGASIGQIFKENQGGY